MNIDTIKPHLARIIAGPLEWRDDPDVNKCPIYCAHDDPPGEAAGIVDRNGFGLHYALQWAIQQDPAMKANLLAQCAERYSDNPPDEAANKAIVEGWVERLRPLVEGVTPARTMRDMVLRFEAGHTVDEVCADWNLEPAQVGPLWAHWSEKAGVTL